MMTPPADAAYQGAPGAFSEEAALAMLGTGARLHPCPTLSDVITALAEGVASAAVVPIENSLVGAVPGVADLIAMNPMRIIGERTHPIVHAIIGPPGTTLRNVRRVWSHPVALAQCTRWFCRHPHIIAMPAFDTAGAVAEVMARGACDEAAIAGRRAAGIYGGIVLEDGVQDQADNFTRFVMLKWDKKVRGTCRARGPAPLLTFPLAARGAFRVGPESGQSRSHLETSPGSS